MLVPLRARCVTGAHVSESEIVLEAQASLLAPFWPGVAAFLPGGVLTQGWGVWKSSLFSIIRLIPSSAGISLAPSSSGGPFRPLPCGHRLPTSVPPGPWP